MALLYSLVARGTTVLAECSKSNSAECKKVAQGLLAKFEGEENLRRSLTHGNFDYCLISDPHVVYLCAGVASKEMTTSTMLGFLSDIKDKWNATVSLSEIEAATTLSLNERFSRTLEVKMVLGLSHSPTSNMLRRIITLMTKSIKLKSNWMMPSKS